MFSYQIAFYINYIILVQMSQSNQQSSKPSIPVSKVIASLKAGDTTYDLTAVRYVNKINQWPTISAEILLKPSGSDSTKVVVDGSLVQELYKIKDSQNEVSVTFGIENETTTVTCIIRSAYIIISQTDIAMNLVLAPSYTKVDNLNLSILRLVDGLFDIDSNLIDSPHIKTDHVLMQYVIESLDKLMVRWERCRQNVIKKSSKIEKKVIEDIDTQNNYIEVLNKTDLLNEEDRCVLLKKIANRPQSIISLSALTGQGCDKLLQIVDDKLSQGYKTYTIKLDPADGKLQAWLYKNAEVISSKLNDNELIFNIKINEVNTQRLHKLFGVAL